MSRDSTGQNFDLKEEIRAYWSERAATFDESASHLIENRFGLPEWHRLLRLAFDLGDTGTLDGSQVLDIACGTGEISRILCTLGAKVTGLDFSEAMHEKSRAKLSEQNWTPLPCDAENLVGVPDASFDFAVTRHLVWTLTNPNAAFAEWARVLKPGGKLLIVDGNFTKTHGLAQRLKLWLASQLSQTPERSEKEQKMDQDIRKQLPLRDGLEIETVKNALSQSGFDLGKVLDVQRLYHAGMKGWPLATRLRQTSANRFAIVGKRRL
jgi:ubiquinone/menaquinone biosynthesis C-methylase UbiE